MEDRHHGRPRLPDDEFDFNAADLTQQFETILRNRRLNELEEHARNARGASPRITPRTPTQQPQQQLAQPSPFTPPPNTQIQQQRPPSQLPPNYNVYSKHPIIPSPPQDANSYKFRNLLITLSHTPTKYENPGLLDEALTHVPIDRIYAEAEEEHNIIKGIAASMGEGVRPDWGYQDCVIRTLLRYVIPFISHDTHCAGLA
jgi:peptide-N4-(N-acetyl-beta-glucosaminyl)asparagine amidase